MKLPISRKALCVVYGLIAVFVWMVLEARRLGMRGVWLYLLVGFVVAISVTVPVFLINRERALAAREPSSVAGTLNAFDIAGLAAVAVAFTAYAAMTVLST